MTQNLLREKLSEGKVPQENKKFKNGLVHRNQHRKPPEGFLNQPNPPLNSSGKRMLKFSFFEIQEP